jgi:quercetin dioxygenase-like cupin family protein
MLKRLPLVLLLSTAAPVHLLQTSLPVQREPLHVTRFENEVVRIFEIAVPVRGSTAFHEHTFDNVTVVLGGDEVTLQLREGTPTLLRIATGQAIFTPAAMPYTHQLANVGASELRLLTVELLSSPPSAPTARPAPPTGSIVLENDRVRALRVGVEPGQIVNDEPTALPRLRVVQAGGPVVEIEGSTEARRRTLSAGDWQWHGGGVRRSLQNTGTSRIDVLDIEIR